MPFEWFVALRYLREGRAQTTLVMAAVSVGVSVIVFLSALITSLQESLIDKTLGAQAHVTLRVPDEVPRPLVDAHDDVVIARATQKAPQRLRSIDQWPQRIREVEGANQVVAVSPSVIGAGFAERGSAKKPVVVRGALPEQLRGIVDLKQRLVQGRYDLSGSNVLVGTTLAKDLGVTVGEKVRIVSSEGIDDIVTIAGTFEIGNKGADGSWVVTSLREAQSLFALPGGATVIELKVRDVFEAEHVAEDLRTQTPLAAESWMTLSAELLSGLSAQSSSKSMIQFFVVLAVALGIASVLIVSVVQKSREIGILRAVGTPSRRVLVVFLLQGGLLGMAGSVVGSLMGAGFALGFAAAVLDERGQPRFPIHLTPGLFVWSTLLATGVGLLAAVIPARRAATMDPARAIRNG
ncbi:MAG: ABC transporter permease [Polyangiaceae bacterium]